MQRKCHYCGTFETDVIFQHIRCSTPNCRAYSKSIAEEYKTLRNKLEKIKKKIFDLDSQNDSLIDSILDDMDNS